MTHTARPSDRVAHAFVPSIVEAIALRSPDLSLDPPSVGAFLAVAAGWPPEVVAGYRETGAPVPYALVLDLLAFAEGEVGESALRVAGRALFHRSLQARTAGLLGPLLERSHPFPAACAQLLGHALEDLAPGLLTVEAVPAPGVLRLQLRHKDPGGLGARLAGTGHTPGEAFRRLFEVLRGYVEEFRDALLEGTEGAPFRAAREGDQGSFELHHAAATRLSAERAAPLLLTEVRRVAARAAEARADAEARAALLAASPRARAVEGAVARAAAQDEPFLLVGERGSGRSAAAAEIHLRCRRAAGPLVACDLAGRAPADWATRLLGRPAGPEGPPIPGILPLARGGTVVLDGLATAGPEVGAAIEGWWAGAREGPPAPARLLATVRPDEVRSFGSWARSVFGDRTAVLPPLAEAADVAAYAREIARRLGARLAEPEAIAALARLPLPLALGALRERIERGAASARGEPVGPEHLGIAPPEPGRRPVAGPAAARAQARRAGSGRRKARR
ncbi:MAG: sigma 54-interacting transcriptional regulator [Planctomycetales bacterium]|nr:sigma 54-interacting transcriptional regulator [Planctomycetales bacterium]